MDEKLRRHLKNICGSMISASKYGELHDETFEAYVGDIGQAFKDSGWIEPQQPEERIAKMLKSGDKVSRLWYGDKFLERDPFDGDWVVMDSLGNKGLGCSLYVGSDLDKALDVLEREGK